MTHTPAPTASRRDRSLRRTRALAWGLAAAAAGLTAGFSAIAAKAFKGHDGKAAVVTRTRSAPARPRVSVPGPQDVPAIAGDPAPLAPPAEPPAAAQPAPEPVPEPAPEQPSSGGS